MRSHDPNSGSVWKCFHRDNDASVVVVLLGKHFLLCLQNSKFFFLFSYKKNFGCVETQSCGRAVPSSCLQDRGFLVWAANVKALSFPRLLSWQPPKPLIFAVISLEECGTIATVLMFRPASDLLLLSSPDWSASLQPEEPKVGDSPVLTLTRSSSSCLRFKLSLFVNKVYFFIPRKENLLLLSERHHVTCEIP